ncbi:MAG: UDP-2,4-diacetamido-2,4,6-trideoxy-beta-L-altropyranose hydrolase [Rickettsiales bacterium]
MNIIFRADSSYKISAGHVMRCLNLADYLLIKDVNVSFICRKLAGNITDNIKKKGYKIYELPADNSYELKNIKPKIQHEHWLETTWENDASQTIEAVKGLHTDWLIVDSYAIDERWESAVKTALDCKIMVIDDLTDRKHNSDILLNQNILTSPDAYSELIPKECKVFLGYEYAMLKKEYFEKKYRTHKNASPENLFIFFGSADNTNETVKTLNALKLVNHKFKKIMVVCGSINKNLPEIKNICEQNNYELHIDTTRMAELISKSDIAIGAGGVNTWERCYLHVPSMVISIADNQTQASINAHEKGYIYYIGESENITTEQLAKHIDGFVRDKLLINNVKEKLVYSFTNNKIKEIYDTL